MLTNTGTRTRKHAQIYTYMSVCACVNTNGWSPRVLTQDASRKTRKK